MSTLPPSNESVSLTCGCAEFARFVGDRHASTRAAAPREVVDRLLAALADERWADEALALLDQGLSRGALSALKAALEDLLDIWITDDATRYGVLRHLNRQHQAVEDAVRHVTAAELERARSSERYLQAVLDTALHMTGLGTWSWDVETDDVDWNDTTFRLYQKEPGSFRPNFRAFADTLHPSERDRILAVLERSRSEGVPVQHERRLVLPDGTHRYVLSRAIALHEPDGTFKRFVGCVQDVTDLKAAHSELARQRELMETLVHHAPATFAYVDRDLVYRWNNRAHCEVLGLPAEAIIGQPAVVAAPGIVSRTESLLRAALDRAEVGRITGIAIRHKTQDREAYWDLAYVPVSGDGDDIMGVLVVGAEVTDRVEAEKMQREQITRLREIDRLKDQFLSIVSHELRTPLNAISGFGSLLADGVLGDLTPDQARAATKMLQGTDALLALIDDLLDMSRIQAGKFSVNPGPVDPTDLIHRLTDQLRPVFEKFGHTLTLNVAPDLPVIQADARRIEQVLSNFLSNAAKFTPRGGHIRLVARAEAHALRFEVHDTGPGIPETKLPMLFQPFSQLDMSDTRSVGGTGLGLSISKGLVEAHGGTIGVDSTPGTGCTFWFTLPL